MDLSKISDKLDALLTSVDMSNTTEEGVNASLPDGYYLCEVSKASLGESKNGNPMVKIELEIIEDGKQGIIRVSLKYGAGKKRVIQGLRRVSKPGLRIYSNCEDMPKVMNGLGIAIVSTSKGVMTDKKARQANVGGEVLAFVW